MAKLYYVDQVSAQAKCDAVHAWMISNGPGYAQSVASNQTKRWAFAQQDVDNKGVVIPGSQWFVTVKDRCDGALTPGEKLLKV